MLNKIIGVGAILALFLFIVLWGQLFENVDADEIMVVQHPTSGELTWHVTPGVKWQGFGKITFYRKLSDIDFDSKVMFNDNGTGHLKGKFQVEMPLDPEHLNALHTKYGSQQAIERSLVQPTIDKVIYMTGPLMSSKESSAERKTDLIRYIVDQIERGIYRTVQKTTTVEDAVTKERRNVTVADLSVKDGKFDRQEESSLSEFGIKVVNFAPNDLDYDQAVKEQIAKQQTITMKVQTAIAEKLEAEQRKITAEADGKALVMKAQYEEEQEKIRAVVKAQKERDVQALKAEAAVQYKREQILIGEGDGERKRAVMVADGALEQKLQTYLEVNAKYAEAIAKHQGAWVPSVVMGGSEGSKQGATELISLLTAKTAKDLALDLSIGTKR